MKSQVDETSSERIEILHFVLKLSQAHKRRIDVTLMLIMDDDNLYCSSDHMLAAVIVVDNTLFLPHSAHSRALIMPCRAIHSRGI